MYSHLPSTRFSPSEQGRRRRCWGRRRPGGRILRSSRRYAQRQRLATPRAVVHRSQAQYTVYHRIKPKTPLMVASGDLEIHGFEILKIRVSNLAWGFWDFSYFPESWECGFEIFLISAKFENMVSRFKKNGPAAQKINVFLRKLLFCP